LQDALADLRAAAEKPYYDKRGDKKNRDAYYKALIDLIEGLSGEAFYRQLNTLVTRTHLRQPTYQPSKYLYPWVDLHPDLKIHSIYSEQIFEPEALIREDFQIEHLRVVRSQELRAREALNPAELALQLDLLEASLPYNCEHSIPQSWFAKKEPMRGDLHHLFACESRCNSFRGNTPYFDFEDFGEVIRDNCGKIAGERFEPTAGKGVVARATFYFLLRYPGEINNVEQEYQVERLPILLDWHKTFPVTDYERHRNAAIYDKQGNRNPLIDFPEWAEKIDFRIGLGA
jgi:endonuclease I